MAKRQETVRPASALAARAVPGILLPSGAIISLATVKSAASPRSFRTSITADTTAAAAVARGVVTQVPQ